MEVNEAATSMLRSLVPLYDIYLFSMSDQEMLDEVSAGQNMYTRGALSCMELTLIVPYQTSHRRYPT